MKKKKWACDNKKRFSSCRDAHISIDVINRTSNRDVIPIRAYHCDCGFWHLTSQEK
jgi:mannose-1-phosphate guanylyltransferase